MLPNSSISQLVYLSDYWYAGVSWYDAYVDWIVILSTSLHSFSHTLYRIHTDIYLSKQIQFNKRFWRWSQEELWEGCNTRFGKILCERLSYVYNSLLSRLINDSCKSCNNFYNPSSFSYRCWYTKHIQMWSVQYFI